MDGTDGPARMRNGESAALANEETALSGFCPRFHRAIELVGRRWTGAILRALMTGDRRFNEVLSDVPGLSDRLLTERLRELEREGIVARVAVPCVPAHHLYRLTPSGRELEPAIRSLGAWAERWIGDDA